jgi:hypothetical protein
VAVSASDFLGRLERSVGAFEAQIEELESEASLVTALDLLDRIERARAGALAGAIDRGDWREGPPGSSSSPPYGELICYRPGRSLSTGEAAVASRGFFDVLDRPPIGLWIEAVARPIDSSRERFETAIITWIPAADVERAAAGCQVCTSGSITMLGKLSERLVHQLHPILIECFRQ